MIDWLALGFALVAFGLASLALYGVAAMHFGWWPVTRMRRSTSTAIVLRKQDWGVVKDAEFKWYGFPYSVERRSNGACAGVFMTSWGAHRALARVTGDR